MNKWKTLGIVFTVIAIGSLNEAMRIFSSPEADIARHRPQLKITSLVITTIFIFLAIWFWKKASRPERR